MVQLLRRGECILPSFLCTNSCLITEHMLYLLYLQCMTISASILVVIGSLFASRRTRSPIPNGAATNGLLGKYELIKAAKTCLLSEVPDSLLALKRHTMLHCPTPKTDVSDISNYRKRIFGSRLEKITSCIQATPPPRHSY